MHQLADRRGAAARPMDARLPHDQLEPAVAATDSPPDGKGSPQTPPPESPPPLPPPRFSLRALLLATALVGVMLAATKLLGALAAAVLGLLALAIVAHVAGNAIGTRLREHGGRDTPAEPALQPLSDEHFVPATNLSHQHSLGWPMWIALGLGATFGGALGLWLFSSMDVAKATWQDTLLGVLAFTAIGTMGGFLAGSFLQVLLRAFREAHGSH